MSEEAVPARRHAIFWLPPPGSALAEFGRNWFGVCPETCETSDQSTFGLPADLAAEATARPRWYTLHGTIVAPFRPADGADAGHLAQALRSFCGRRAALRTGPMRLTRLTRFLVLMPESGTATLDWLAADCVTHFNAFRAPTTPEDMARYPADRHSQRQRAHVRQFGYPYVLSDFLFHITLAGPLSDEQLDKVEEALEPHLADVVGAPLEINSLSLLTDPGGNAPFQLVERCPLVA